MAYTQTIQLDCPPGDPRPDDLIEGVIENLDLPKRDHLGCLFGWWVWDYSDIDPEHWKKIKPTLKRRIGALYKKGIIRAGGWGPF
jgi:hypothetical protein